ncbi:MAG: hypothetical protein IJ299_04085, partial [Oscillospiraceae bacterium]|nr:hypothetical protein [Oscillospiraceae bacterium]
MDSTEKKAFRKSLFGGFSKDDVNAYLGETIGKYTAKLERAEKNLSEKTDECAALTSKLRDAEAKIAELTKVSAEAAELRTKYTSLIAEHELVSTRLAEKEALADELSARVSALSETEREYAARKTELADI